jgi:hypothetical protein
MIPPEFLGSKKLALIFKKDGQEQTYFVKGRNAQALLWLVYTKEAGVTALEVSSWALRLGAYIFVLRRAYGLSIATIREPHEGGNHARYVLRETVELLQIIPEPEKA